MDLLQHFIHPGIEVFLAGIIGRLVELDPPPRADHAVESHAADAVCIILEAQSVTPVGPAERQSTEMCRVVHTLANVSCGTGGPAGPSPIGRANQ